MKRSATAVWNGPGKTGKGKLSTDSEVLENTAYSFSSRFESEKGTNPEELIAAALAGCYAMKLSFMLDAANMTAKELKVKATYNMEKNETGWQTVGIHLDVSATIPDGSLSNFKEISQKAKSECPISKILATTITLEARLSS